MNHSALGPRVAPDLDELAGRLDAAVEGLDPERLPDLAGLLETARVRLQARLTAVASRPPEERQGDRLLDAEKASERLSVSKDWLYRNASKLPFVVRVGTMIRFSEAKLVRFITRNAGAR